MKFVKIWLAWFKLWWQYELAYRLNFALRITGILIYNCVGPILALVIYSISAGFPGWKFEEFLLIQGLMIFVMGFNDLLFSNSPWIISDLVRRGELDNLLIRPISPLKLLLCWAADPEHVPQIFTGLIIACYAGLKAKISAGGLLNCAVLILAALAILAAFIIILSSIVIFTVKANALIDLFNRLVSYGAYPLSIYGPTGAFLFTFILPVGIIAYYPAQALLGQLSPIFVAKAVLTAVLFLSISLAIWNLAIRKYTSAGG